MADIESRQARAERRSSEDFLTDLADLRETWSELAERGVDSEASDFDTRLTTDDIAPDDQPGLRVERG